MIMNQCKSVCISFNYCFIVFYSSIKRTFYNLKCIMGIIQQKDIKSMGEKERFNPWNALPLPLNFPTPCLKTKRLVYDP